MFRYLKKKTRISIENKNQFFFCNYPTFIFDQKLFITFVSKISFLHNFYFHVCYEKDYQHKKFKNRSI